MKLFIVVVTFNSDFTQNDTHTQRANTKEEAIQKTRTLYEGCEVEFAHIDAFEHEL